MPQEDVVVKEMVVGGPQTQQCLRETFLEAIGTATDFKMNNLKVRPRPRHSPFTPMAGMEGEPSSRPGME